MKLEDSLPSYAQSAEYVAKEAITSDHQKHLDLGDGHLHGPCNLTPQSETVVSCVN